MGKIEQSIKNGHELSKVANHRFGYSVALKIALDRFRCCDETKKELMELARSRSIAEFDALLSQVSTKESGEPNFVTIRHPRDFSEFK